MIYFIVLSFILKLYGILNIYQQAHYKIKEYALYFLKNILFYSISILIPVVLTQIISNMVADICLGIYIIIYSLLFIKFKVRLVFSKRIIRLLIFIALYFSLLYFIKYANIYLFIFSEFTIIPLLAFDILLAKLLNKKYIIEAKRRLDLYSGKRIIITGSYGKTSTKLLFNQILNIYSSSIATPKSYNTPLGIASFINNEHIDSYSNVILEYGASKAGDITKLLEIGKPDVAVVTEIGLMHMNSFKSINNVINEKMKLIDGAVIAILNYDNKYIREYKKNNPIILSYGFEYGDFNARNVYNGEFDFYYKNKFIMHFETNLIGDHQILNLLASLSYAYFLGYDFNKIKNALRLIRAEDKRLELKKYADRIVLDDSFNSNYQGFVKALEVLGYSSFRRFLITPGIVELGKYKRDIYIKLSKYIEKNVDVVILVGRDMYHYLKDVGTELYIENSFKAAYKKYMSLSAGIKSTVLIENDLPDIYIKRGLLF